MFLHAFVTNIAWENAGYCQSDMLAHRSPVVRVSIMSECPVIIRTVTLHILFAWYESSFLLWIRLMLSLCTPKFEIIRHRISIVTEVKKNCRIRKKVNVTVPVIMRHTSMQAQERCYQNCSAQWKSTGAKVPSNFLFLIYCNMSKKCNLL